MSDHDATSKTSWLQNKKIMTRVAIILVVTIALIAAAYTFHWDWSGLTSFHKTTTATEVTQPSNNKKVTTTVEDQPAKTLWDWLQLLGTLAIPIVVAVGTAVFTT